MTYLLALDQGTSSSRSIVFDRDGRIVSVAQRELRQFFPQPGWVEHDPVEIWTQQRDTAREALAQAGLRASDVAAVGIANQRETTLLWDRATGEPLHRAIVWQDRRTESRCATLRGQGRGPLIAERTGLVVDPYFSATKLAWLLDHVPDARARAERGELAFGTVDTWLLWNADRRPRARDRRHATRRGRCCSTSIAARGTTRCSRCSTSRCRCCPTCGRRRASSATIDADVLGAPLPIGGIAGDQQAALFGQACFEAGVAKNTYGTGCFLLMHTGASPQASTNGLVTTRAAQRGLAASYALEGSVFVGGAVVQWLRDGLRAIETSADVEALAATVPDSGGVVFVPAFTGLGAPYWNADARGTITGLTRGTTIGHVARAALESIAFQSAALLQAMSRDASGSTVAELRVDGGASVNDLLMQFQADLLGVPVVRPAMIETTALGAAFLAGLTAGVYADEAEIAALWKADRTFVPVMSRDRAASLMAAWERAVRQTVAA